MGTYSLGSAQCHIQGQTIGAAPSWGLEVKDGSDETGHTCNMYVESMYMIYVSRTYMIYVSM